MNVLQQLWSKVAGNQPAPERIDPAIIHEEDDEPEIGEDREPTGRLTINALTYDEQSEQIRVDMDWDEEFVAYLKRNGFNGATDESIVQKYVATLYRNMVANMTEKGQDFE